MMDGIHFLASDSLCSGSSVHGASPFCKHLDSILQCAFNSLTTPGLLVDVIFLSLIFHCPRIKCYLQTANSLLQPGGPGHFGVLAPLTPVPRPSQRLAAAPGLHQPGSSTWSARSRSRVSDGRLLCFRSSELICHVPGAVCLELLT